MDTAVLSLVLNRLRTGTWIVWLIAFVVALLLFLFAAPPEFRLSFKGLAAAFALYALSAGISLLQIERLGRTLVGETLGPAFYRPLTRFPQTSSLLFFYLGACLNAGAYLWVKVYLGESVWVSSVTVAMFMVLTTLG
ncbi:MAG TPA: hypothetical protein DHV93_07585, partial [Holophagaceae bacterium]|nr:hypothetical protein [Holophagaceae bacterium]